jgi:hypothetical protein
LEELSDPAFILLSNKDDETKKGRAVESKEEETYNSNTNNNGNIDKDNSYLQDNDECKGLPLANQHKLSLSCNPAIKSSYKRRF